MKGFQSIIETRGRDYICPCGKSYLSYPALFTHVKQKHEGRAPGDIIKPNSKYSKRGRPPLLKSDYSNRPSSEEILPPMQIPCLDEEELQRKKAARAEKALEQTIRILEGMPCQEMNKTRVREIEAFNEMSIYLNTEQKRSGQLCIGKALKEYLQAVCGKIQWVKFEQLYTAYILFLQFIIEDQNNKLVIRTSKPDLMCEYVNEFLEEHVSEMAEFYEVGAMTILESQRLVNLMHYLFTWLSCKQYVNFEVVHESS